MHRQRAASNHAKGHKASHRVQRPAPRFLQTTWRNPRAARRDSKSTEIAELLTSGENMVSAQEFAERFGMDVEEAVVFLEWVKVGVKFKEQAVDVAKKNGFGAGATMQR